MKSIAFDLTAKGRPDPIRVWLTEDTVEVGTGAVMPSPLHYLTLRASFAHIYPNGMVSRFGEIIAHWPDDFERADEAEVTAP